MSVELEQHEHLVAERQQPLGSTRLFEFDAIGCNVDLRYARLGVQVSQHVPELRVNRRLATDELHRIERALLCEQITDVAAKGLQ